MLPQNTGIKGITGWYSCIDKFLESIYTSPIFPFRTFARLSIWLLTASSKAGLIWDSNSPSNNRNVTERARTGLGRDRVWHCSALIRRNGCNLVTFCYVWWHSGCLVLYAYDSCAMGIRELPNQILSVHCVNVSWRLCFWFSQWNLVPSMKLGENMSFICSVRRMVITATINLLSWVVSPVT